MKTESIAGKTFILWDNNTKLVYICDSAEKGEVTFSDTKSFFAGTKTQIKSKIQSENLIVEDEQFKSFLGI